MTTAFAEKIAPAPAEPSAPPAPAAPPHRKPLLVIRPTVGFASLRLGDVWHFRDLLMGLAGRDLKLRYKQTALGVAWVLLQPLLAAGIFSFVFGKVARMPSDGIPYFLFSYAGLLGWNLFSNTLTKVSVCLVGNSQLISKVFFPRLVLPLSAVPSALIDFAVAAVMLAVIMAVDRVAPGRGLLLLPCWTAILLALALGIGLCAAALMVSYRDVQYVLPVFVQLLLYASPVAYAASAVPQRYQALYQLNPLAPVLDAFRWSVFGGIAPRWGAVAVAAAVSFAVLAFGAYAFKRMERRFADVI